jgi:formiminoglutamate deiminase
MTAYWCEYAWLPDGVAQGVTIHVENDLINRVSTDDAGAERLHGMVFPGFANAHSHAFHRALRGRTHADGGTFWTWREAMYALAATLDPDSYLKLARAVYAEMALAGITSVGEFHYLHHAPGGHAYADPNAMGHALQQAAADAGIRITLLDTLYLTGSIDGAPLNETQQRFSDGDLDRWWSRASDLDGWALHSVRAVPARYLRPFAELTRGGVVHVHLSEQPAENADCLQYHGCTPTELLNRHGVLQDNLIAVHATHLSTTDIDLLGANQVTACFAPTTEGDLADGIGPARELVDAGSTLCLGSDQHVVIDMFAEARALEHGERLRTGHRGRFTPAELTAAMTGHAALGQPGGALAPGWPADLVAVRMDTPRTAGCNPGQVMLAASAADIHTVVSGGRLIARDGVHSTLGEVGGLLHEAITEVWEAAR